jgi:hypothetical protein
VKKTCRDRQAFSATSYVLSFVSHCDMFELSGGKFSLSEGSVLKEDVALQGRTSGSAVIHR